jgi:uncharacterized protein (UPF0332 family)
MEKKKKAAPKEEKKEQPKDILPPEFEKLPEDVKKKLKEIQGKIETFQKKLLEKFDKYILGIAVLPPKNIEYEKKKREQESKAPLTKEEEENLKNQINVFVLIDDTDSKRMSKEELTDKLGKITVEIAKEIDKNLVPEIKLISEIKVNCEDGKYEILETMAQSQPVYDPREVISSFKISEVHKRMVLNKFEKYIVAYSGAGSLFRGEKSHDIDVYIIIDDTDVKRMSRTELRDKLRSIIYGMGHEAAQITGVQKQFHIQTYILTDFWEGLKEANPVFFTLLRDGVPLYDRGVFMPWKQLLQMGRIRPSKEAIDLFMSSGEQVIFRVKERLKDLISTDIYYAVLNPSQAAIMLYGLAPPTPKETVQIMEDIFVKKEKMLEKRYVDILEKIRKYFKDIEHGTIKEVSGKELDELLKNTDDYLKRIRKLFTQIEAKRLRESVLDMHENIVTIVRDTMIIEGIQGVGEEHLYETFKSRIINTGKIPQKYSRKLKELLESKKRINQLSKTDVDKVTKEGREFIRFMYEYIQRRRGQELDRARIRVKYGDKFGEVTLLDEWAFIVYDIDAKEKEVSKAPINKNGSLGAMRESTLAEFEQHLATAKIPRNAFIKENIMDSLTQIFGKDMEVLVNNSFTFYM